MPGSGHRRAHETITSETTDGVAVLRLNRPHLMNALTTVLRAELPEALLRARTEARVIVLTGAGCAFRSGQDLADAGGTGAFDVERVLNDEYVPLVRAITDRTARRYRRLSGRRDRIPAKTPRAIYRSLGGFMA